MSSVASSPSEIDSAVFRVSIGLLLQDAVLCSFASPISKVLSYTSCFGVRDSTGFLLKGMKVRIVISIRTSLSKEWFSQRITDRQGHPNFERLCHFFCGCSFE